MQSAAAAGNFLFSAAAAGNFLQVF